MLPSIAFSAPWTFDAPLDVTSSHGARVFHHLDSAGRKSIAARDGTVGVVWEDNRDGMSRCYFARKSASDAQFTGEIQLSGKAECYEPAVAALDGGRFLAVWEESGRAQARAVANDGVGDAIALGESESAQASVGVDGNVAYAAWTEKDGRYSRVRIAHLAVDKKQIRVAQRGYPDAQPPKDDQLYPSIAPARTGEVAVAWEDRRNGHTFIVHTFSKDGEHFDELHQVNETHNAARPATTSRNRNLGRGPGAMRAALARIDEKLIGIVWMDKRDFLSGYDVYAAFSIDGGRTFGKNQKVQDGFGDSIAQWHPAIAARAGAIAVVWDDDRDETVDTWLSWKDGEAWADNIAPKGAAGPGLQSDPSIALDDNGELHLVWIDRDVNGGPSRLRYVRGHK